GRLPHSQHLSWRDHYGLTDSLLYLAAQRSGRLPHGLEPEQVDLVEELPGLPWEEELVLQCLVSSPPSPRYIGIELC
ncbi:unnamed protein product, partial [Urochloa humidicola]